MRISKGYGLFMIPEGETYRRLSTLMGTLASHYGSPNFVPHVTLLGDIETDEKSFIRKSEQLATEIRPFQVRLRGVGYTNQRHKALFLTAERNWELVDANRHAQEVFGLMDMQYEPHLSLVYGDFHMHLKAEMIEHYVQGMETEFTVDTLHLFDLNRDVEDWGRMGGRALK